MKTFTIVKKNRKFFAIKMDSGFESKLLIDDNSSALEAGSEYTLDLNDDSVRTKYGCDSKYSVKSDTTVEQQLKAGVITLASDYNTTLVSLCQEMGGTWDGESKVWVFSDLISEKVDELDDIYNSEKVAVEFKVADGHYFWGDLSAPVTVAGIPLAGGCRGRDDGTKIYEGVAVVEGSMHSGGSRKNYGTKMNGGTIIRMRVPKALVSEINADTSIEYIKTI